jgi:hypothetical protein
VDIPGGGIHAGGYRRSRTHQVEGRDAEWNWILNYTRYVKDENGKIACIGTIEEEHCMNFILKGTLLETTIKSWFEEFM